MVINFSVNGQFGGQGSRGGVLGSHRHWGATFPCLLTQEVKATCRFVAFETLTTPVCYLVGRIAQPTARFPQSISGNAWDREYICEYSYSASRSTPSQ